MIHHGMLIKQAMNKTYYIVMTDRRLPIIRDKNSIYLFFNFFI